MSEQFLTSHLLILIGYAALTIGYLDMAYD